jgi:hypothetical protein
MSPCEKAAVANTYGAKFHGDVRGASYVVKLTIILKLFGENESAS